MDLPKDREQYCTLYLVRHGETEMNVANVFQGHIDSPLTENGIVQAERLCEVLRLIRFEALFSSDLTRTRRTAEILNAERKLAVQTSQLLRELYGGEYEGRDYNFYLEAHRKLLEELGDLAEEERVRVRVGNGETDEELVARGFTILREIAVGYPGKNVLVVSHGGMIRRLLIHLGWATSTSLPPKSFSNCGYAKLLCDGIDFFVEEVVGVNVKNKP